MTCPVCGNSSKPRYVSCQKCLDRRNANRRPPIDHIYNNGSEHRKKINQTSSMTTYRWLRNNNYPHRFQILCWNCNVTKQLYGSCPHVKLIEHRKQLTTSIS
jgi:hypothetical protein